MRTMVIAVAATLLAAAGQAQTGSKPATQTVGQSERASKEDMNIRAYIELLRTDIRKSKSQIMGEAMELDANEAAKFWPVYKDFETEFTTIGDKVVALVKDYAEHYLKMTDGAADGIANQVLAIETQRNDLKKKYYGRFKSAVGAVVATRFLQVENQLERLVDLQIAAEIPVIWK
jgi:hypothetical protein